jgi:alkylated DNA repair dioxygenase AlkB
MSSTEQLDLFHTDSLGVEPSLHREAFDGATRHRLDEHSWITHVHGLVAGDQALVGQLSALPGWEQRSRWMYHRDVAEPRLTNEVLDMAVAPSFLVTLARSLSEYCAVSYDTIWLNWYRDHDDSTSWHADRPADEPATATVPVVSLGATRRFLIRPAGGGPSVAFTPLGGDVLIMHGRCQRDWRHSVPKQRQPTGGRVSLNFNSSAQVGA